jgi:hypothetical protein
MDESRVYSPLLPGHLDHPHLAQLFYPGTEIPAAKFTRKMYPRTDTQPGFKYPDNRLLPLQDVISEALMRHPDVLDYDGEVCLYVIKNGLTTRVTIRRTTDIFSHVREYFYNQSSQAYMEWPILPYDNDSGIFSAGGDFGSVIVDGRGRDGDLLTGGAGKTTSSDVTHATHQSVPRVPSNICRLL